MPEAGVQIVGQPTSKGSLTGEAITVDRSGVGALLKVSQSRFDRIIQTPIVDQHGRPLSDAKRHVEDSLADIARRRGIGAAFVALYLHGINTGYLKESPEQRLAGKIGEYLNVPIREFRRDTNKLVELGILSPPDETKPLFRHEDGAVCNFCSGDRMNPKQAILRFKHKGVDYEAGFTFVPFGNPVEAFHFVVWPAAHHLDPQTGTGPIERMDLKKTTFGRLISLTDSINRSLQAFAAEAGMAAPIMTGIFNGWAGNSIYHQHFQFMAGTVPLQSREAAVIGNKAETILSAVDWPLAVFRLDGVNGAPDPALANTIALAWKSQRDQERVYVKVAGKDHSLHLSNHTQNLIVPGGNSAFIVPRLRTRLDFTDPPAEWDAMFPGVSWAKQNVAALECAGVMVLDTNPSDPERDLFEKLKGSSTLRDDYLRHCLASVNPSEDSLRTFSAYVTQSVMRD